MSIFRRRYDEQQHISDEDISAYVDAELSTSMMAQVETHLATCDTCTMKVTDYRALKQSMGALPRVSAPRSFVLSPESAGLSNRRRARAIRPAFGFVPAMAMTVLVLLVAIDLGDSSSREEFSSAGNSTALSRAADEAAPEAARQADLALPTLTDTTAAGATTGSAPPPVQPTAGAEGEKQVDDDAATPSTTASASDEDGGASVLRLMQVAAALVLLVSGGLWFRKWLVQRKVEI